MELEESLRLQNDWWVSGEVKEDLAPFYKREAFHRLKELADIRQIVVLSGLRRVGKTTLFYQIIQDLINKGVPPRKLLYFSFDEKIGDLKRILDEYQKITGLEWKREKLYVFFDEIHKLEGWGYKLKLLYDNFPNLKFFVSGSSSVDLEKEAYSNLVGRHTFLKLEPLSLKEFFELKRGKEVEDFEVWEEELFLSFPEYLRKPFPEIVNETSERRILEYFRENVVGKIIYRDLPTKFKEVNEELLFSLVDGFYQKPGVVLNLDGLSRDFKISKKTLIKHLFYLRFSYLIRIVKNFRVSIMLASRKMQKIYPYHWSLIFGFHREVERGSFLEAVAASLLDVKFYWRKGMKEIDFLIKNEKTIPIEVKSTIEIKNLLNFMKIFNVKEGMLIHDGRKDECFKSEDFKVRILPLFKLAFSPSRVFES